MYSQAYVSPRYMVKRPAWTSVATRDRRVLKRYLREADGSPVYNARGQCFKGWRGGRPMVHSAGVWAPEN